MEQQPRHGPELGEGPRGARSVRAPSAALRAREAKG